MKTDLELLKESESDLEWYRDNSNQILKNFEGELIAIKNRKILAHAPNMEVLLSKIKEKNESVEEVLIEYIYPKNFRAIF